MIYLSIELDELVATTRSWTARALLDSGDSRITQRQVRRSQGALAVGAQAARGVE
jgi:hypothetical protein